MKNWLAIWRIIFVVMSAKSNQHLLQFGPGQVWPEAMSIWIWFGEVVAAVVGVNQILTAAMICELVSGQFNVSVKELQSKSRKNTITTPRQIAMYLARKHTEESLVDIGKTFNRDHSTVLHAIKVVSNKLVRDTSVNAQVEILSNKVKQL